MPSSRPGRSGPGLVPAPVAASATTGLAGRRSCFERSGWSSLPLRQPCRGARRRPCLDRMLLQSHPHHLDLGLRQREPRRRPSRHSLIDMSGNPRGSHAVSFAPFNRTRCSPAIGVRGFSRGIRSGFGICRSCTKSASAAFSKSLRRFIIAVAVARPRFPDVSPPETYRRLATTTAVDR